MSAALRAAAAMRVAPKAMRPKAFAPIRVSRPISVRCMASSAEVTAYTTVEKGGKDTLEYRMFFNAAGKEVSPWHDIPLYAGDGFVHYVCEITKETSAKMECATDEPSNPIKQDVKKGKLRFYPYNINWNYGFLPQTWEDPAITNKDLGAAGDNDPVDVVALGAAHKRGSVYKVKPVGVLAMIDDGELDWKVIAVSEDDPKAASINDVADLEKAYPGEVQKVLEWFRDYKIPDGKPANKFGYDNKCMDRKFTEHIIAETHEAYVKLRSGSRTNSEELSLF